MPISAGNSVSAGGFGVIRRITTAASQTTVDFTAIPASFTDLIVVYQARSQKAASANDVLYVEINGDGTAANYATGQAAQAHTASWDIFTNAPATTYGMQLTSIPAATATATYGGTGSITFSNYVGTTFFKDCMFDTMFPVSTVNYRLVGQGVWLSTAAITRLTFSLQGQAFVDNSNFTLHGIGPR